MNAISPWRIGSHEGAFTTGQVGRLVGRDTAEIAKWTRGSPPLILSDYEPLDGRIVLSFDGLIEARLVSHMLRQGVPLRTLRNVSNRLKTASNPKHPFSMDRKFVSEGFRMFERDGDRLVNLANDCYAEPALMGPALDGKVVFERGRASYYLPYPAELPHVHIDPRVAFGRPVVVADKRAVPTAKLAETARVEGPEATADWFGIPKGDVDQAVSFEERLAA